MANDVETGVAEPNEAVDASTQASDGAFSIRDAARGAPHGRIDRFMVLGRLGEGGMGTVFLGQDLQLDRKVAIKLLHARVGDQRASTRLLREAQGLARLSHPNVVQVYEAGVHEQSVYLAMEHIKGRDLRTWMKEPRARARSWRETLAVMIQAGRGLEAAHSAGLIHRDFKPSNAILGDDGRVRVLDFGLVRALVDDVKVTRAPAPGQLYDSGDSARTLDTRSEATQAEEDAAFEGRGVLEESLTRTGAIMGTPAYMSPEQHAGHRCDALTDQFAFCVTLHEALYGVRPIPGATVEELRRGLLSGARATATTGDDVPRRVGVAIERGLSIDPSARWPDMRALLAELERAAAPRRRSWGMLAAASGLAVASLAGGVALTLSVTSALPPKEAGERDLPSFPGPVLMRLRCNGGEFLVGEGGIVFELRGDEWIAVGHKANSIVCEDSKLRCRSTDDSIWEYEGAPNEWVMVRRLWSGAELKRIKTAQHGDDGCLESGPGWHGRGAHMDACRDVTGQDWHVVPAGPNVSRLKTEYRGEGECLDLAPGGNALMNTCAETPSQRWTLEQEREGFVLLKNQARAGDECLTGNNPDSPTRGGESYMSSCVPSPDQRWRIVKR